MKKYKTTLTIVCAYHEKNFGYPLQMGTKEGEGVEGITGGICKECYRLEMKKLPKRPSRWNLVGWFLASRKARRQHEDAERQAEERDNVADIFTTNPNLHARVLLIGKRYVHYLMPEDLEALIDQVADQPEIRCKWN